jgi:hypothetical protein
VRTLHILIQHLRQSIPLTCWFGFQVKAPGYDYAELVSVMRFKNPVTPQNKKHPLLLSTVFLLNTASERKWWVNKKKFLREEFQET